jgi:hypothetical protein
MHQNAQKDGQDMRSHAFFRTDFLAVQIKLDQPHFRMCSRFQLNQVHFHLDIRRDFISCRAASSPRGLISPGSQKEAGPAFVGKPPGELSWT